LGYAGVKSVLQAVLNAQSADSLPVSIALRQLRYNWYKGEQFYRKCDHQSVQSVVIVESKSKGMRDPYDVFNVLGIEAGNEANLRSCEELGHKISA
jgi:branched-chain amino acid transport system substrate-binding protein